MSDSEHVVLEYLSHPRSGVHLVIAVPSVDDIGGRIAQRRLPYEFEMLSVTDRLVRKYGDVIDVGANIGNHTLFWACHSGVKVYAFEPPGEALSLLSENLRANDATRVAVYEVAAGSRPGRGTLQTVAGNLGASKVALVSSVESQGLMSFPVIPIDEYCFGNIGLIKVDVEGQEAEVLAGARLTLIRERPVLWIEVLSMSALKQIRSELRELGYRVPPVWLSDTNVFFVPTWRALGSLIFHPSTVALLVRRGVGRRVRASSYRLSNFRKSVPTRRK